RHCPPSSLFPYTTLFRSGWKYAFNDDWGMDVGVLYYYYPGSYVSGATKPDTTEIYLAGSWKWASLKYSYSVDHTFGVPDNAWYLDRKSTRLNSSHRTISY